MCVDILITTYNRRMVLEETVKSLLDKVKSIPYRLFIVDDCSSDWTADYLKQLKDDRLAAVVLNKKRSGVVCGFDMLWRMAEFYDSFYSYNPYMCYLQDDMKSVEEDWLLTAINIYEALKQQYPIGLFSGHDAHRHPVFKGIAYNGRKVILKKSQGMTNLIGEKSIWKSIGYVPRLNPNGKERGLPDNCRGSNIDVYVTGCYSGSTFGAGAAAANCLVKQNKLVMVIPGMLEHIGEINSTWRKNAN